MTVLEPTDGVILHADPFADDVLERLIASNHRYQREHGHYIVPLSQRLLDARREVAALELRVQELEQAQEDVRRWFRYRPWEGAPDSGSFGCGPYSEAEMNLGYGTYRDPRHLPAVLAGGEETA